MGRAVAISGGNLVSTRQLNLYAITLTKKQSPNVLFVGTASRDAEEYSALIEKEFLGLGCNVKSLCLCAKHCSEEEIKQFLTWADMIYVGGGDTVFMMRLWKQYGLDQKLKEIYEKDLAVLTGISAGAICWFDCGHSDSEYFTNQEEWKFVWANGMLGLFPFAYCPHYNEEGRESFDKMLMEKNEIGLAMENDTAFVENNGKQYFLRSHPQAKAFWVSYKNGILEKWEIVFEQS